MYLHTTTTAIIIGPKFELNDFPGLMSKHQEQFPGVSVLENEASQLILGNFAFPAIGSYIRNVCKWGNFAGVGGRVIKNNTEVEIQRAFEDAYTFISGERADVSAALSRLNRLHGLGTPSFASKHLRFLKPELCPVYDAILTDKLPYPFTPAGYAVFSNDCQEIAAKLNSANIGNPARPTNLWVAADVEAAMFAHFYR